MEKVSVNLKRSTWKTLSQMKLDYDLKSFDEVLERLLSMPNLKRSLLIKKQENLKQREIKAKQRQENTLKYGHKKAEG